MFQTPIRYLLAFFICTNLVGSGLSNDGRAGQGPQVLLPVEIQSFNKTQSNAALLQRTTDVIGGIPTAQRADTQPSKTNIVEQAPQTDNTLTEHSDNYGDNNTSTEQETKPSDEIENETTEGSDVETTTLEPTTIPNKNDTMTDETSGATPNSPCISEASSDPSTVSLPASTPSSTTTTAAETIPQEDSTEGSTPAGDSEVSKLPLEELQPDAMSSGTIALVMAIVFAVVVVLVYIGLLVWRRYLEYRYGNRELLVNDLEFDTNDLRHFEL